uniref:Septin-type G domain-containing protein n=1 Tax=Timema genevievae TaxID=629358 RepID=A0A7R9JTQ9_TIMGE|nr:unnamed protein product [Timema genevievae]
MASKYLTSPAGFVAAERLFITGGLVIENLEHCDFIALRNMLIRTHLQDLKDVTNNVHYENFRCRKLAGLGTDGKPARISNKNPLAQMEEEKRDHDAKMKKMETEMEQVFEMKVREKKQKLKDSEADLQRRHDQMRKSLSQQIAELEERQETFEKEKKQWEQLNNITLEEMRRRSLEANSKEFIVKLTSSLVFMAGVSNPPPAEPFASARHFLTTAEKAVDGKEKSKKKKGLF